MKTIETSKCIFYIKDIPSLDLVYNDKLNEYLLSLEIIKLSEITEEQASEIVEDGFNAYNEHSFKLYNDIIVSGSYVVTALQSFYSLLESHNIEITNNRYIFKV